MNKKKIVGIVLAVSTMITMVSPTFACTPPLNPPSSPHIEINWEPSDELKEAIRLWVKKKLDEYPIILETDKETETEETNIETESSTEIESESEIEAIMDRFNDESIMETEIESENVNDVDTVNSEEINDSLSEIDLSENSKSDILENTANKNSTEIICEKETNDVKNTDVNAVKNNKAVIIPSPSTVPDTSIKHLNKKLNVNVREKENVTLKEIKPVEETHKIVVLDKIINWRNRVKGWFITFRK